MKQDKRASYEAESVKDFRELISRTTKEYPDHIAYKYKIRYGKDDVEYIHKTYSQFKKDIEALSTKLLTLGLKNKKIAVISNNRYEWCTTYLAVTTGDMIIVPLDKALPENELETLILRSGVEAIVCEGKYVEIAQKIKNTQQCNLKYIISMDKICQEDKISESVQISKTEEKDKINLKNNENNVMYYQTLLAEGRKLREQGNNEYEAITIDPEKMSILLFTSGTTSAAKGVILSQKNICTNMQAIATYSHMWPTDTLLSVLPIHHTFECTITFLLGIYFHSTVAFCEGLKYIQKNMQEYKASVFVGVPLILENINKKVWKGIEEQGKTKIIKTMILITKILSKIGIDIRKKVFKPILDKFGGNLRIIFVGAAPLDKSIIKSFNDFGVDIVQGYGLTETSPVISCESDKMKKPGSIGFPLYNLELKIENPNEEGIGEITVKGPSIMKGYYKNEEATQKAINNGWFSTGDYGYLDKKGYLYICGRKSDIIVLKNGKNIYPQELENLLNKLPTITESMVFARNKDSMDTTLCAKIVYDKDQVKEQYGDISEEQLKQNFWQKIKEINKTLPDVKHIKEFILTDEPLEKTTTQKVKRFKELNKIEKTKQIMELNQAAHKLN